eukprot:GHVN01059257.1.p1 GENE.GHVN01059257.1~~GHVN01059257.1.p1  ORF type:complete len:158 (+),score=17.24 GHVN01059257.1:61-534(+)
MQIFVRGAGETVPVDFDHGATLHDLKQRVETLNGCPTESQIITHGIRLLDCDIAALCDLGIEEGSTVYVTQELTGGKKKKKRVYSTPKKGKHKKKKVKLSILKCYKVEGSDSDPTVVRLRKACPASSCGQGVFMAHHTVGTPRSYCGRCSMVHINKV